MYQSALIVLTKPLQSKVLNYQGLLETVCRLAQRDLFVFLQPGLKLDNIADLKACVRVPYTKCLRENLSKIYHFTAMHSSLNARVLLENVTSPDAHGLSLVAKYDVIFTDQSVAESNVNEAKRYLSQVVKNSFTGDVCFGCFEVEDGEEREDGANTLKTYDHVCAGGTFDR